MITQTHNIGGTSNKLRWEKECRENLPSFWDEFCKSLHAQNRIFLTFQNCSIFDLQHSVFVNMTNMVVNRDTALYMCMEVIICQSDVSPEM